MMVSIIIPVYNVEKYLNKCVTSVINQTHRDIEILMINDGSTDRSGAICKSFAESDHRIKYIEKQNEGLGPTRNMGLDIAAGEYVLFVDSDDWLELNAVEVLVNKARENDADIVYMNFYYSEYDEKGCLTERPHIRFYEIEGAVSAKELTDVIFDGDARMWSKMFRRSLFIDHSLYMPAHPYEDFPIMPLLVIYAERVCQVDDVLYHYYYSRPNNIIGNDDNKKYIFKGIGELYTAFEQRGFLPAYDAPLEEYIVNMSKFALNSMTGDISEYITQLQQMYPNYKYNLNIRAITWGSYNTLLIARNLLFFNSQVVEQYMFSSIISAMSPNDGSLHDIPHHDNAFRDKMIIKDVNKDFFNKDHNFFLNVDYIFIDFLEEIGDIIKIGETYYTNSEAQIEAGTFAGISGAVCFPLANSERLQIWEEKCLLFIDRIRKVFRPDQVILLKHTLCEVHGPRPDVVVPFDDIEDIKRMNAILCDYYAFFESNFPGITIIEASIEHLSYTYEYTKFGCLPQYYNGMQNKAVAELIQRRVLD